MKIAYKGITFDDFVDESEEYGTCYVEMCSHCYNKHESVLGGNISGTAWGTCSVDGCWNEADYYIDFNVNEVEFK